MATHSSVLAGESQGRGSLVGCRLWGRTDSDTTEATQQQQQQGSGGDFEEVMFYIILFVLYACNNFSFGMEEYNYSNGNIK